jgi:glycosyltransferase involved in cell wall biosynthesis
LLLDALERIRVPDGGWLIVVADNGSTDATHEIIKARQGRLPITYVFEGKPGKNRALNRALPLIEGDLVVFTDDDVIPDEDWLTRLVAHAAERREYAGFGGKVLPLWQIEPPDWVTRLVAGPVFAITNPTLGSREVGPESLWGPNFALRASLFRDGLRFDEAIGPDGTSTYRMGSETSLLRQLGKEGHRFWFCPDAVVRHIVRPHQLEPKWILRRAFRLGRSLYHVESEARFGEAATLIGVPRWRVGKYLRSLGQYGLAAITGNFDAAFTARWEGRLFEGYLFERGQSSRSRSTPRRTPFRVPSEDNFRGRDER